MDRKTLAAAFPHTVPVLMGYLSIGVVFGWMMTAIGYIPIWSAVMSLTIYAGSGQYLGVSLLDTAAPLADVAFLTLILNFRHLVYGLSLLEKFQGMGWRKLYMIFSLTDETYALLSSAQPPAGVEPRDFYFAISLLDQLYWVAGSVLGGLLGAALPINTQGADFAMTALFVVIALGQWEEPKNRPSALLGLAAAALALLIFGPDRFLIPALLVIVLSLLALGGRLDREGAAA